MEAIFGQVLYGVVLPLLLAATALAAFGGGPLLPRPRPCGAAPAVALGFMLGFHGLKGLPLLFARESLHVVAQAAAAGLLLALLEGALSARSSAVRSAIVWLWRLAAVVAFTLLTAKRKASLWSGEDAATTCAALIAGWAAMWAAWDLLRGAVPGPEQGLEKPGPERHGAGGAALVLLATVGTSSIVLGLGGSAIVAQLGGALAMAFTPVVAAAWWRPDARYVRFGAPALLCAWGALLVNATLFIPDLPRAIPALLALAPLAANVNRAPFLRARAPWLQAGLATVATLVPIAIAGWIAWEKTKEMGDLPY